jgi:hypothetical protein
VWGKRYRRKEKVFPVEVGVRQRLKAGGARMNESEVSAGRANEWSIELEVYN